MLRKLKTLVVMLVLLTITAMSMAPLALGQEKVYWDAPDPYPPTSYWVYSPEMGGYVYCRSVDMSTPVFEICMENGIIPRHQYGVHPDGGIIMTA